LLSPRHRSRGGNIQQARPFRRASGEPVSAVQWLVAVGTLSSGHAGSPEGLPRKPRARAAALAFESVAR